MLNWEGCFLNGEKISFGCTGRNIQHIKNYQLQYNKRLTRTKSRTLWNYSTDPPFTRFVSISYEIVFGFAIRISLQWNFICRMIDLSNDACVSSGVSSVLEWSFVHGVEKNSLIERVFTNHGVLVFSIFNYMYTFQVSNSHFRKSIPPLIQLIEKNDLYNVLQEEFVGPKR